MIYDGTTIQNALDLPFLPPSWMYNLNVTVHSIGNQRVVTLLYAPNPVIPGQVDGVLMKILVGRPNNPVFWFKRRKINDFSYEVGHSISHGIRKNIKILNQFLGLNAGGLWEWKRTITLNGQIV